MVVFVHSITVNYTSMLIGSNVGGARLHSIAISVSYSFLAQHVRIEVVNGRRQDFSPSAIGTLSLCSGCVLLKPEFPLYAIAPGGEHRQGSTEPDRSRIHLQV